MIRDIFLEASILKSLAQNLKILRELSGFCMDILSCHSDFPQVASERGLRVWLGRERRANQVDEPLSA